MDKIQKLLTTTDKTVFKLRDLANIWGFSKYDSLKKIVNDYVEAYKLQKITKGYYYISGREFNLLELANKLRTPSYISFETVLHKEGVIFQWDDRVTLASKESINMSITNMKFIFRQIKSSILLNKEGISEKNNYYIASKERALLDTLYINPKFMFDNLDVIDFEECRRLLSVYNRKSLNKIIDKLEKDVREK